MGIAIQATRFARVCLEDSLKYSYAFSLLHHLILIRHKRETFGKKLVDHAVIRNKLAHMARKIEATHAWMESLIYQTTRMPEELQMLKLGKSF